ncbi:hypothetical protein IID27_01880 [Patescibacteria group bacterium]|nr:hypothetical protein [Patescibacteria group bacterium]
MDRKIIVNVLILVTVIFAGVGGYIFLKNQTTFQETEKGALQQLPQTIESPKDEKQDVLQESSGDEGDKVLTNEVLTGSEIFADEEIPPSVLEAGGDDSENAESEVQKYKRDVERIRDLSQLKAALDAVLEKHKDEKPLPIVGDVFALGRSSFGLSDESKEIRDQITAILERDGIAVDEEVFEDPRFHTYAYGYVSPDGSFYFLVAALESAYFKDKGYCHPLFNPGISSTVCGYVISSPNAPLAFFEKLAQDEQRKSRDGARTFTVLIMMQALELYYDDNDGMYPSTMSWENLIAMLIESGILVGPATRFNDPDPKKTYTYVASPDQQAYVLRSMFETAHDRLESDEDGVVFGILCDDPYYCIVAP